MSRFVMCEYLQLESIFLSLEGERQYVPHRLGYIKIGNQF